MIRTTIIFLLAFTQIVAAQQFAIYPGDQPDIMPVWHRVADYAPVLRSVESARISPDGRLAVSASKFGYYLMAWRVADGALLWEKKQSCEIECIAFAPDGMRFVTGDENFMVTVWDAQSGNPIKQLEHDSGIDGITWSHDGKLVAAGSEKGDVWLWDTRGYKAMGKIHVGSTVNSLDFSKDDKRLVAGGNIQTPDAKTNRTHYGGFVKLIDLSTQAVSRSYEGPKGSVKSVRFSPDEKFIASGGFDSTARLFETQTGRLVKTFEERLKIEAVAFTPDGQYILCGGHRRQITFYRLADMELAYQLSTPRTEYIDFSADGRLLLTAHEDSGLLSLYMILSGTHKTPGLYQKIEDQVLDNRDLRK